jgi:hypothetical protein
VAAENKSSPRTGLAAGTEFLFVYTNEKRNSNFAFNKPYKTTWLERNKIHTENLLAQEFRLMR